MAAFKSGEHRTTPVFNRIRLRPFGNINRAGQTCAADICCLSSPHRLEIMLSQLPGERAPLNSAQLISPLGHFSFGAIRLEISVLVSGYLIEASVLGRYQQLFLKEHRMNAIMSDRDCVLLFFNRNAIESKATHSSISTIDALEKSIQMPVHTCDTAMLDGQQLSTIIGALKGSCPVEWCS